MGFRYLALILILLLFASLLTVFQSQRLQSIPIEVRAGGNEGIGGIEEIEFVGLRANQVEPLQTIELEKINEPTLKRRWKQEIKAKEKEVKQRKKQAKLEKKRLRKLDKKDLKAATAEVEQDEEEEEEEETLELNCPLIESTTEFELFPPPIQTIPEEDDSLHSAVNQILSTSSSSSSSGSVLRPNYTTIWLTGFTITDSLSKSWTEDFPRLFAYRYPDAKVFVVRQSIPNTPLFIYRADRLRPVKKQDFEIRASSKGVYKAAPNLRLIPDPQADMSGPVNTNFSSYYLRVLPRLINVADVPDSVKSADEVFNGTSAEFAALHPPDLHFIRNVFSMQLRVSQTIPTLLSPKAFRVVYPVLKIDLPNAIDLVFQTERFPKIAPGWQINLYENTIRNRILNQGLYEVNAAGRDLLLKSNQPLSPTTALTTTQRAILGIDSVEAYHRLGFQNVRAKKDNFLFVPGSITERKGQLYLVSNVDPCLLKKHNLSLIFAGAPDADYWASVEKTMKERGISYKNLGFVFDKGSVIDLYVRARGLIELPQGRYDPGPRTFYEALYGNTPSLTSVMLGVDERFQHLGIRLPTEQVPPAELNEAIDRLLRTDWDDIQIRYARRHMSEQGAYGRLFNEIDLSFCARSPEKCVEVPLKNK